MALYGADEQTLEDLAGFIAVADILEGFGGVLTTDVEHYFFTTAVRRGQWRGLWERRFFGRGVLCADGGVIDRERDVFSCDTTRLEEWGS